MTEKRDVATATAKMIALLEVVAPKVLAETWNFYRGAPRQDDQGRDKYTGILYRTKDADGNVDDHVIGTLADQAKSEATVANKFVCIEETGNATSIEGRDPSREPPWWGGAIKSFVDNVLDGITGGTELQDHLLLACAQKHAGAITEEEYEAWTALEHPGIRTSIADSAQYGLTAGSYLSLKNSIEAYFRAAVAEMEAAA